MRSRHKLLALALSLALLLSLAVPVCAAETTASTTKDLTGHIVILHTNDVHGAVNGYACIAALKADYEAKGAEVILVDAGDYSQGEVYVSDTKGLDAVEMMNVTGYDVVTLGNHEFDYGYAQLKENMTKAEDQLNSWMRGYKNAAFGRYKFSQVVNTDPKLMKLNEIQEEIKKNLVQISKPYGLEIVSVGINTINVPKAISEKVFDRMIQERQRAAAQFLAQGNSRAEKIRIDADREKAITLANAEAQAKEIRAQGDAEAAKYYAVFKENPELAEFLRKLDSLRQIMKGRTTLVLDTNVAPFDLFKPGAEVLGPVAK